MRRSIGILLSCLLVLVALGAPASVAAATPAGDGSALLSDRLIPVKVDSSRLTNLKPNSGGGVPDATHAEVIKVVDLLGLKFNTAEWQHDTNTIVLHLNESLTLKESAEVAQAFRSVKIASVVDPYSVKFLQDEANRIVSAVGEGGRVIISAGPNSNNSGISIILNDETLNASKRDSLKESLADAVSVPVEVTSNASPVSTGRQSDPIPPHWGGAKMSTPASEPGKVNACSTGFGVGRMDGSTLVTENLTAHHCGAVDTQWRTGLSLTSTILGLMKDAHAGGPDLQRLVGAEFEPVVYTGGPNSGNGIPVRGFVYPILNDYYCNTGAPSGLVCGNKVTSLNQTICYPAMLHCYTGNTYTDRDGGGPAVGNGDSGGPTFAVRDGRVYAAGIISGMFNLRSTCEGEPPTQDRRCGNTSVIAPVTHFLVNNPGYGVLVAG